MFVPNTSPRANRSAIDRVGDAPWRGSDLF